ncbi:MAG: binding domain, excisionase family [Hyphomicrobiales bacterium]|nr:binding domain, excisionase family [Hyphomicrobiales bacterium]
MVELAQTGAYKCRMEYLTTAEAADYLRLGERKLYELVSEGAIPCSKVTGKWLFPRHELDRWVMSGLAVPHGMRIREAPPIVGGSQDGLLEWALRESSSGLASLPEGTEAGVERLLRGEVIAAAIHYHSARDEDANPVAVRRLAGLHDGVLAGFVRREQGLLLPRGNALKIEAFADVLTSRARMAVRQKGAGAQMLLDVLLERAGASHNDLNRLDPPCLTGPDLAAAVASGAADCGIATRSAARSVGLDFVPLVWEHFDLLMRQSDYFRPPLQALLRLLPDGRLARRAADLTGYDVSLAGQIRFAP